MALAMPTLTFSFVQPQNVQMENIPKYLQSFNKFRAKTTKLYCVYLQILQKSFCLKKIIKLKICVFVCGCLLFYR